MFCVCLKNMTVFSVFQDNISFKVLLNVTSQRIGAINAVVLSIYLVSFLIELPSKLQLTL